jgi:hypothetical protein
MRTRVYIDGFNLYCGCLKGTPAQWLNPALLEPQAGHKEGGQGTLL